MTGLIRWEPNGIGWLGYAGTRDGWLFQVWHALDTGEWALRSRLLPQPREPLASDPDELKARAEELLREFAASLGALFPDEVWPPLDEMKG